MALIITLQEGQGFYVGDRRWYVEDYDDGGIWLRGPGDKRVRITEEEAVEIEPNVMASEGFIPEMGCRVVLDAPRSIAILRDELWERAHPEEHNAGQDGG